jgi:hypothetical protein
MEKEVKYVKYTKVNLEIIYEHCHFTSNIFLCLFLKVKFKNKLLNMIRN